MAENDDMIGTYATVFNQGRQAGREEVVRAVNKLLIPTSEPVSTIPNFYFRQSVWRQQLKEWGMTVD